MAFNRTTWVDGDEPAITGGELNRLEQGVLDAHEGRINDEAITGPKIADGGVTSPKLADGSVTSPKLADEAVTNRALAPDSVRFPNVRHNVELKDVTSNYTLTAGDAGRVIKCSNANSIDVTVPANLPSGFISLVVRFGSGDVRIRAGAGATLLNAEPGDRLMRPGATVNILHGGSGIIAVAGHLE